jgi:hypothetical protein
LNGTTKYENKAQQDPSNLFSKNTVIELTKQVMHGIQENISTMGMINSTERKSQKKL